MEVIETGLPGVMLIRTAVFRDQRGRFLETWQRQRYADAGIAADFAQDNAAFSRRGVLRGLHYQWPSPQGKLVSALDGEIHDVAVDIRTGSPTRGRWIAERLSADNGHQLWIPEGFAHGYLVLSDTAIVAYKATRPYDPGGDAGIRWDDQDLAIDWPRPDPILSPRDLAAPRLSEIPEERLPTFRHP